MAAQDAELKLKVSLDLAFFRQQLSGLGAAAAGYKLPINVAFDRRSVQNELNALSRNFSRRNYRIEVKTNLDSELRKARELRDLLSNMPVSKTGSAGVVSRTKGTELRSAALMKTLAMPGKGGFDADAIRQLAQKAVDVGLKGIDPSKATKELRKDLRDAFDQAGDDATRGLVNSLLDGRTSVGKAATGLGEGILSALRTSLKTQSPSKETRKIGKDTADGLEIELIKGLDKIEGRVDGKVKDILASLKQLAMIRGFMTGGFSMEGIRGQQQNMANFAKMLMASAGGMAGIIRMPGGFQERGRLQRSAGGINAAMTGGAFANIRARQQGARGQTAAAASTTPSFMTALPLMMGMKPGELKARLQGLYGQQFNAPQMGGYSRPNEKKIDKLIDYLARSATGRGSLGAIVSGTGARSGILPGTSSTGYIGRTALSAQYVNYPPGMPAAYGAGFAGAGASRYGMAQARGSLGQFPMAGPMAPSPRHIPSPGYINQANSNTAFSAMGGTIASFSLYGGRTTAFPMSGMMVPSSPYGRINAQTSMFGPNGPIGPGNRPPGGIYGGYGGRTGGGGILPPGGFPSDGMMGPQSQLGAGYFGVGKALDAFSKSYERARSYLNQNRLPLGGAIAEVGSEFGNAVKQVLLFGTAYKALAFLTDLPNQAFEAAKGLATYRNQLQAVTGNAAEFERSFAFVDNLATRFNVPLQSARDGFVKLYASMKPAGFNAGEIENLFTGISKATAAFGLSADKVDRVNYAFAQMASKGQIMSEELKGQLGDVLPGALALFARAAQMTIPEFSKAMEDGAFKGKAMQQVLGNVAILMNRDFGPAALGASKTLQGALTQIQNNLKLMYESMTPIVNQFAAVFGPQVNRLIKDVTSTMQVLTGTFIKGSDAVGTLSPRAQAFYNTIQQLKPALASAGAAVMDIGNAMAAMSPFAVQAVSALLQFAASPFGKAAAMATIAITALNGAINLFTKAGVIPAVQAVYNFISGLLKIPAATGAARIGVLALRAAVTGLVIGGVLIGLDILISKIIGIGNAASNSKDRARELALTLDQLAGAGDLIGLAGKRQEAENQVIIAERLLQTYQKMEKIGFDRLTKQERAFLQEFGEKNPLGRGVAFAEKQLTEALENRGKAQAALEAAQRASDRQREQTQQQLAKIDLSASEKTTKTKEQSLESLENLADQLAKARNEGEMERANMLFEHKKRLLDMEFAYAESGADDIQQSRLKMAKELADVMIGYEEQVFKAQQEIQKAAGSVAPGNRAPIAPKGKGPYGPISQFGAGANANLAIGTMVGGADFPRNMTRPVSGSESRDVVAAMKATQAGLNETLRLNLALKDATKAYTLTIKQNFDTIFPIAQLQLQNKLLAMKNSAELPGVPQEVIDMEKELFLAREKSNAILADAKKRFDENLPIYDKYNEMQKEGKQLTKDQQLELTKAAIVIESYADIVNSATEGLREFTIVQLESAIASMKQADALKAQQEITDRINQAVSGVTGTYKTLFKEIAKGGDAVEALKKAQEELADQFLTMFFDFAMKPVEDFFKKTLGDLFGLPDEEAKRKETIDKMQEQLDELKAQKDIQKAIKDDTGKIASGGIGGGEGGQTQSMTTAFTSLPGFATSQPVLGGGGMTGPSFGGSISTAINGLNIDLTGLSESLNELSYSAGAATPEVTGLATDLTQVGKTVSDTSKTTAEEGSKFKESLGKAVQGIGIAAGAIMGIAAGISQIKEGGTSNVLGGIGSILMSVGGAIGGFGNLFGWAKGGVVPGGFKAFANGGLVQGPTLGLVGEGRYNEAVVPLPDGRSIPVEMRTPSIREIMASSSASSSSQPVLNMKFETTNIAGVEYVSRDQLERAMAETRKLAANDGARRGMGMTLDRLQQSPSTRSKIGLR